MNFTEGGVCAPKGFKAGGIHCGIRKNKEKKDLALIYSEKKAAAAAVYTQNLVKGAPLLVTQKNLEIPYAHAIICNSGNANTCNANGKEVAWEMCRLTAEKLGILPTDVIVASTGVIGQPLNIEPIKNGIGPLVESLSYNGSGAACEGIMTTDTVKKEVAVRFTIDGKTCTIGGIAKGSGMIHPNMATMLVFLTTDAAITPRMLAKALKEDTDDSFNMISVDGDTSTNDMVCILANGLAGNTPIETEGKAYEDFKKALSMVTTVLCRKIAKDGEGATKLIECAVLGASDRATAKQVAKSVICSSLVKAAMFGADANWGRILCAIGYSGADVDVTKIDVSFKSSAGEIAVCRQGCGVDFSEEIAKEILLKDEITILVNLNAGSEKAVAWGCDLTYEYVRINGDYRT
ncbi:MAG TPA: bifunctional ornithine acetyltransferase/N-acetylglutamate synthase [Bacillota bacterium]|nr:bifunctional ornithine acetyltransferase/N-acetylglutamate synthase [Bacillota bacterium]HOK68342.1 bifunctional ornithine acetyltransferase/N-acetylglutamate synthase [Bacillota bacterium]HPP85252.1 bifunctional ornithine acetyltransferase/N-acetylglutamate synthase [Bacillota bacterium]